MTKDLSSSLKDRVREHSYKLEQGRQKKHGGKLQAIWRLDFKTQHPSNESHRKKQ